MHVEIHLVPATTLMASLSEKRWACAIHVGVLILAFLTSWAAGLAGTLGAAVVLIVRPMNSEFIAQHAREALNFNLSMFIYMVLGVILAIFTLGIGLIVLIPLGIVLALVWLVCSIQAAIAANDGLHYQYPFTMRLF
jgi:uncharacterized Tic20 family protein